MSNMRTVPPLVHRLWEIKDLNKSRSRSRSQNLTFWYGWKGIDTRKTHAKFEIPILNSSYVTVLVLVKLTKFAVALRLRCGSCKLIFDIISSFFVKFKNVVHSLEPGETPSNSASHQAPNYVQRY